VPAIRIHEAWTTRQVLVLACVAALASCGGDSADSRETRDGSPSTTEENDAPDSRETRDGSPSTTEENDAPDSRETRDGSPSTTEGNDAQIRGLEQQPRPPGLAAQVGIRVGAGPEGGVYCRRTVRPAARFAWGVKGGTAKIGNAVAVCFTGFDLESPLLVTATGPDGSTSERELGPEYVEHPPETEGPQAEGGDSHQLLLLARPELAPGRYVFEASQGERRARAAFRLLEDAIPALWVAPQVASDYSLFVHPDIKPGTAIEIVLTGLPAGRELQLHLYGRRLDQPRREDGYIATFPVTGDGAGNDVLRIPTSERDRGLLLCPVFEADVLRDVFGFEPEDSALTSFLWCRDFWFSVGEGRKAATNG
jgi:hypothetical protein